VAHVPRTAEAPWRVYYREYQGPHPALLGLVAVAMISWGSVLLKLQEPGVQILNLDGITGPLSPLS
jgi:hypothetical protein